MEKKIKRFQRLATLRKKDISKEIANSNLLENEITKNKNLIDQINTIMDSSKDDPSKKIISSGVFKNNAHLLNTRLQESQTVATAEGHHRRPQGTRRAHGPHADRKAPW